MKPRRVVITGLGALTPIGNTLTTYWEGLLSGTSGAGPISYFDPSLFKTQFACELKNFNPLDHFDRKESRKYDRFAQYALVSVAEAIEDAKLPLETIDKDRVGVIWGAGIGGLETFQNEVLNFAEGNQNPRFNPFFIPKMIADIAPGLISIKYGFRGPNFATVSACASASNAMIDALNYIRLGFQMLLLQVALKLLSLRLELEVLMLCTLYQREMTILRQRLVLLIKIEMDSF
jgi:3-oxoacyl-[acyl-carrier-protein] synthase II